MLHYTCSMRLLLKTLIVGKNGLFVNIDPVLSQSEVCFWGVAAVHQWYWYTKCQDYGVFLHVLVLTFLNQRLQSKLYDPKYYTSDMADSPKTFFGNPCENISCIFVHFCLWFDQNYFTGIQISKNIAFRVMAWPWVWMTPRSTLKVKVIDLRSRSRGYKKCNFGYHFTILQILCSLPRVK